MKLETMCTLMFPQFTAHADVRGKLAPRYNGPFPVIKKVLAVAYKLQLPAEMSDVHNVFHVSQLRKCLRVPEEQVAPRDNRPARWSQTSRGASENFGHCDEKNPQLNS